MTGYLIDLFFSLKGTASRREWFLGAIAIAVATIGGVLLFNNDSFEESINAAPEVPTMAAVLWAALCLYAFFALSTKRLNGAGLGRWASAIALPGFLLLCGWGLGYFLEPLSSRPDALALWALLAASLPPLFICASRRDEA
jgi:uncharacterized membrane protein YhaH (DUF805 family)